MSSPIVVFQTRRSVTGYVLLFGNTAIAWKSRVQPVVATSSTEAEFYAAVTCAKAAKYLRSVLQQLEAIRPGVTPLFIDNQAAILWSTKVGPLHVHAISRSNISLFKNGKIKETLSRHYQHQ